MTTAGLPHSLLRLFQARPPIVHASPLGKLERKKQKFDTITQILAGVEDPKSLEDHSEFIPVLDKDQRRTKRKERKVARGVALVEAAKAQYNPTETLKLDDEATEDPLKTLFIGRLAYDITEEQLRREFDEFGPIRKVKIVKDTHTGKSRGYGFVEYEREKDLRVAYARGDGRKINNRRCVVDVERGRTVPGWLPRRMGGGKGKTRVGSKHQNITSSGRDEDRPARGDDSRGGDRGGYGGSSYGGSSHGGSSYSRDSDRRDDRGGGGYDRRRDDRDRRDDRGYDRRDDRRDDRRRDDRYDSRDRGGGYDRGGSDRGNYDRRDDRDRGGDRERGGYGSRPERTYR